MIYSMLYVYGQISELILTTEDMYGDPYNYQSFYTQECVFDISNYKNIMGMSLFFYQKSGSFYSKGENYMPYTSGINMKLVDNLFTKDPYVCLGYDLADFDSEQAILYSLNSDTYLTKDGVDIKASEKTIRLRWLHQYENNEIKVINEDSELTNYEIRWYRFYMGAPSPDEYAGVYWKRLEVQNESNKNDSYISQSSPFTCILNPAVNVAQEQIKAIVLYEGNVIRSNIITFYNEKDVASQATADLLAGLSIWCDDNSYGNYFIYGQNNNLFDESKANEILTLKAKFADNSIITDITKDIDVALESPDLTEAKSIVWEFPLKYTMIIVHGFNYSFENKIHQAIKNNKGIINGIDYSECLIGEIIDTTKISEIDPEGKIYKLNGYFTAEKETIKVLGNTIYISRKGNETDYSINNKQEYRINKTYNATSINNTVKCTISKNSLNYAASKEMSFGLMGTNGTDATIVIDFEENKSALTAGLVDAEALKVVAHLYDFNHNEVDFNNIGLNLICHWEWSQSLGTDKVTIEQRERYNSVEEKWELVDDTIIPNTCFLSYGPNLDINDNLFLILKVTVSGFGDYDLIAYKAIPVRASRNYRNLIGATEVLYSSTGHADYYKSPYELLYCADVNEYDMPQAEIATLNNANLKWSIYSPYKKSAEEDKFYGEISKENILQPLLIYTKDADPYGVICSDANGNRLWIQPLVILQNEYPSATLNKWDGKSIEINYEDGTMVAPAIAAGKKNSDNTFSGVMLGDWSSTDTAGDITQQTGVYGFHHGAMTYAFKEDGTAFIGKSGLGRILFDGNSGTITSSAWNINDSTKSEGLYMDLDNGILKMQANRNYRRITSPKEKDFSNYYISLDYQPVPLDAVYDPNTTYYIPVAYSENHRGNSTYIRYFYYKKEGEETYTKASSFDSNISGKYYFPIKFNAVNFNQAPSQEQLINYFIRLDFGYIKAQYNSESGTGLGLNYNSADFQYYSAGEKGYITLSADESTYPLGIGMSDSIALRNFRVRWDGTCYITDGIFSGIVTADELYCDYGFIGGWEIDETSLSGGKTVLDSYSGIFTNRIGIIDIISAANDDGILGEIGLVQGADGDGNTTYNIGIISKNQSIVLDTSLATGSTSNIALRSKSGAWFQCQNFYVMGIGTGWMSNSQSIEFHTNKLIVSTPNPSDQTGIYARFA